jgi:hypothetical protein
MRVMVSSILTGPPRSLKPVIGPADTFGEHTLEQYVNPKSRKLL